MESPKLGVKEVGSGSNGDSKFFVTLNQSLVFRLLFVHPWGKKKSQWALFSKSFPAPTKAG